MANYIQDCLEDGEKIILTGRLHWTSIWSYLLFAWLFLIVGIVLIALAWEEDTIEFLYVGTGLLVVGGVIYLIGRIIRTRSEFAVTTSRFIQKDGIFNIKMTEIPLFKVETVNFYQSLWQRLFNTGCIELVGSGGTPHRVNAIEKPMSVRKTILATIGTNKVNE